MMQSLLKYYLLPTVLFLLFGNALAQNSYISTEGSDSLKFYSNGSRVMVIQPDGSIKIGTGQADPNAILDLSDATKGLLLPRMTSSERDALGSIEGMLIYNTDNERFEFFESGGAWEEIVSSASGSGVIDSVLQDNDDQGTQIQLLSNERIVFTLNGVNYFEFREGRVQTLNNNGNVLYGFNAGRSASLGLDNTAFGSSTLAGAAFSGDQNTAVGKQALDIITTGNNNTAVGYQAGHALSGGGSNNTFIGRNANPNTGVTNSTAIGYNSVVGQSNAMVLGNGVDVGIGTSTPDERLHVTGGPAKFDSVIITNNAIAGYVLTSVDALGNASWQSSGTVWDTASGTIHIASGYNNLNFVYGGNQIDNQAGTFDDRRFHYNYLRSSFRAGQVTGNQWDDFNTGNSSIGLGQNTIASGANSISIGNSAIASAQNAVALGNAANATALNSFAAGTSVIASGNSSAAFGQQTLSESFGEFVVGIHNTDVSPLSASSYAAGDRLFVVGNGASPAARSDAFVVMKDGKTRIGSSQINPTETLEVVGGAAKFDSVIITNGATNGYVLTSNATGNASWQALSSTTTIFDTTTSGIVATNVGSYDDDFVFGSPQLNENANLNHQHRFFFDKGQAAFRAGRTTSANTNWNNGNLGLYSAAFGINTLASGPESFAFGGEAQATAEGAFAGGNNTVASGNNAVALGLGTSAPSANEIVLGSYNTTYVPASATAFNAADRLFVIANGSSGAARSEAMVILKSGNVGIGTVTPQEKLHVDNTFRVGSNTKYINMFTSGGGNDIISEGGDLNIEYDKTDAVNIMNSSLFVADGTGLTGFGTNIPTARVHIVANGVNADSLFRLVSGSEAAGKVLTSNADGFGTWEAPVSSSPWNIDGSGVIRYQEADPAGAFAVIQHASAPSALILTDGTDSSYFYYDQSSKFLSISSDSVQMISERLLIVGPAFSGNAELTVDGDVNASFIQSYASEQVGLLVQGDGTEIETGIAISNGETGGNSFLEFESEGDLALIEYSSQGQALEILNNNNAGAAISLLADSIFLLPGQETATQVLIEGGLITDSLVITEGAADGFVLTSDADGKGTWQSPASGGPWTESGDITYLTDLTDSVGIGTTAPLVNLHVASNDGGGIVMQSSGGGSGVIVLAKSQGTIVAPGNVVENDELGKLLFSGYNNNDNGFIAEGAAIYAEATEDFDAANKRGTRMVFQVRENGAASVNEVMEISNDGNVGIGVPTSPSYALHVETNNRLYAGYFKNLHSDPNMSAIRAEANNGGATSDQTGGSFLAEGGSAGVTNYGIKTEANQGENAIGLYATATGAANGNYAAIFDKGNVGVGTTVPVKKIHIATEGPSPDGLILEHANDDEPSQLFFIRSQGDLTSKEPVTDDEVLGRVSFAGRFGTGDGDIGDGAAIEVRASENYSSGNTGSKMFFSTILNGDDSPETRMVIENDGHVGIGTDTAEATLHVEGSLRYADGSEAPGRVLTSDAEGNATWQAASGGGPWTENDGQTYLTDLTDSLGIGINDPQARLHLGVTSPSLPALIIENNNATSNASEIVRVQANSSLTNAFVIERNGNVGIGLPNPAQLLHLASTSNAYVRLERNATNESGVEFYRAGGTGPGADRDWRMALNTSGFLNIGYSHNDFVATTELMRFQDDKVTINQNLDVEANIEIDGEYQFESAKTIIKQIPINALSYKRNNANTATTYLEFDSYVGGGSEESAFCRFTNGSDAREAVATAPLYLPDGAIISDLEVKWYDQSPAREVEMSIVRVSFGSINADPMVTITSSGSGTPPTGATTENNSSITNSVINNNTYCYYIRFKGFEDTDAGFSKIRITYTINKVD